jgi:transposase
MTSKGMEKMTHSTIGVDIAKDTLEAYRLDDRSRRCFDNTSAGHKALLGWTGKSDLRVVFEPAFEQAMAKAGVSLVKVNPRQARRFAEASGRLAKGDAVDAAMLAHMAAALELAPRPVASQVMAELRELNVTRQSLVRERTAASNRAKALTLPLLRKLNAARLKQIGSQIAAIEAAMRTRLLAEPELAHRLAILVSIPGISEITAFALLIDMPELGSLEAKQAAALAGLAPMTRQSGRWTGRAFIRGGRASLRRALYMPALAAARFNPELKAKYHQLIAAGKPAKLAITALMRKLVILANALLKAQRQWSPKPA